MSVQQHSATTALLADPSVQAAPAGESFNVVAKGYHKGEVDEWVRWALSEIESLGHQVVSFASHEAGSPQGQQLLTDLMALMMDEITGRKQAAAAEVAQMMAGARQQVDSIISDARKQSDSITSSATQQASALVSNARADAKKTTDAAEAHAAAVNEAAGTRTAQLTRVHADGIARMQQMHDVTEQYLAAESQRGSLTDEVTRAMAPVTSSAAPR